MLGDGSAATESDGHKHAPWGMLGGHDGVTRQTILQRRDGERIDLPSKFDFLEYHLAAGDKLIALGPSGGGYGNPLEREPESVLQDVLDELITAEIARNDYGVVITEPGQIDRAATERLRCAK